MSGDHQRPYPGVPVVDADGHILEPRDLWERELPDKFKEQAIKIVWNEETQKEDEFVQNVNVAPGVGTCNGWARLPRSVRDDPTGLRWEDLTPAGLYGPGRIVELDRGLVEGSPRRPRTSGSDASRPPNPEMMVTRARVSGGRTRARDRRRCAWPMVRSDGRFEGDLQPRASSWRTWLRVLRLRLTRDSSMRAAR